MYESGQQRAMATELARNGGNIAKAVEALRRDFETMSQISDDTLRRNLENPEFQMLVKEQEMLINAEVCTRRFRKTSAKVPHSAIRP